MSMMKCDEVSMKRCEDMSMRSDAIEPEPMKRLPRPGKRSNRLMATDSSPVEILNASPIDNNDCPPEFILEVNDDDLVLFSDDKSVVESQTPNEPQQDSNDEIEIVYDHHQEILDADTIVYSPNYWPGSGSRSSGSCNTPETPGF